MTSSDASAFALAEASPAAVAAHDHAAWLGLFAEDGVVEDPVGTRPHTTAAGLRRFWDVYIAPNDIRFEVHRDLSRGLEVMRDVTIHVRFPTGATVAVPSYVLYALVEAPVGLRIRRLAAHWELPGQIRQLMGAGFAGVRTSMATTGSGLVTLGPDFLWQYTRALFGVGARGHRVVEHLAAACTKGDSAALVKLVAGDVRVEVAAPGDGATGIAALLALVDGATWTVSRPVSSGLVTAFRYELGGRNASTGVALATFARAGGAITSVRFFDRARRG